MEITTTIGSILNRKGTTVWSVSPTNTVFEAISMMAEKNIGALPVLEGDRLVGLISERDYARKVILLGRGSQGNGRCRDHDRKPEDSRAG